MSDAEEEVDRAAEKERERAMKREKALNELVETETTYARLLGLLIMNYVNPLKDGSLVTEEQFKMLFPQIEIIQGLSEKFLADLRKRRSDWDPQSSQLSDLFDQFVPFFRMYQGYVNNYDRACGLLRKLENKQKWNEYATEARGKSDGFNLASLLILPIQRIPRYKLLLSEILKNTKDGHPDKAAMEKALEKVVEVSTQINDNMKDFERRETVRKIEDKFTGNVKLLAPARKFIRTGKLWKVCRKNDRVYTFFLFSDLMLYASTYGTKLNLHNQLEFNKAFDVEWLDDESYGAICGRAFRVVSSKKSFVVYADDEKEARSWFDDVKESSDSHKGSAAMNRGNKKEDGEKEKAAIWVPDAHHSTCTMPDCNLKFTMVKRRHHCRRCGALVCGPCSKYKMPNAEGVMLRACKRCYFGENDGDTANGGPSAMASASNVGDAVNKAFPKVQGDEYDDDSSDDEFQEELVTLHGIPFYVDETELSTDDIFVKFGRGVGSYLIVPALQEEDAVHYTVTLCVYTPAGIDSYKIALVTKKNGINFRLTKRSGKTRDFNDINVLVDYLSKKDKLTFSYAIPKQDVTDYVREEANKIQWQESMAQQQSSASNIRGLENYPRARALFDYESSVLGDLCLKAGDVIYVIDKEGDEGWWSGVCDDKQGLFPSTYVELLDDKPVPTGKNEPRNGDVLIARFDYREGGAEELTFEIGDRIVLMEKDNSGWWLGQLEKSGAVGWFAPDLTAPIAAAGGAKDGKKVVPPSSKAKPPPAKTAGDTSTAAVAAPPGKKSAGPVFSYADLKARSFDRDGIDMKRLERYLSGEEFATVFGMSKDDFDSLPLWKQRRLKKQHELF